MMDTTQRGGPAGVEAFLGKGSQINGKVTFGGPGRIEGKVEGEIAAQDALVIGESAVVTAQITGETIVVHGRVTGDVTARQKLELRAGSRVSGNISAPRLVVEEGAIFEGQCAMGGAESGKRVEKEPPAVARTEKRPEAPALRAGMPA